MRHPSVEFSLQEESDYEPVYGYHAIGRTLEEEQHQGSYHCDRSLETEVEALEEAENEFEVYILELVDLGLRETVSTLLGHL